jgi:hypothetical protein
VSRRFNYTIEPMTLGKMRELGVRSLDISCWLCHRQAALSVDRWPDHVAVPMFGPRMVCMRDHRRRRSPEVERAAAAESLSGGPWRI